MNVTARAANFIVGVIVKIGVFAGVIFWVIRRPARMLPKASRRSGFISEGLDSLIGWKGANRGEPIVTK